MFWNRKVIVVLVLLLSGCASVAPQAPRKVTLEDLASIVPMEDGAQIREWDRYIFDIQVQADQQVINLDGEPRILKKAGAAGTSSGRKTVQVNAGLWKDSKIDRPQARIVLDYWLNDGGAPNVVDRANLTCEEWAQGRNAMNAAQLEQSLKANFGNRPVEVRQSMPAYQVGQFWIVPVDIQLKSASFAANCLQ